MHGRDRRYDRNVGRQRARGAGRRPARQRDCDESGPLDCGTNPCGAGVATLPGVRARPRLCTSASGRYLALQGLGMLARASARRFATIAGFAGLPVSTTHDSCNRPCESRLRFRQLQPGYARRALLGGEMHCANQGVASAFTRLAPRPNAQERRGASNRANRHAAAAAGDSRVFRASQRELCARHARRHRTRVRFPALRGPMPLPVRTTSGRMGMGPASPARETPSPQ
jgi:hypothetical protein